MIRIIPSSQCRHWVCCQSDPALFATQACFLNVETLQKLFLRKKHEALIGRLYKKWSCHFSQVLSVKQSPLSSRRHFWYSPAPCGTGGLRSRELQDLQEIKCCSKHLNNNPCLLLKRLQFCLEENVTMVWFGFASLEELI